MKLLKFTLISFVIIYSALIFLVYLIQNRFIFAPDHLDMNYYFSFEENFEEKFLKSSHGHNINYLIFKRPNPERVILYFHGNAGALDSWGLAAEELSLKTNSDVWIMDYPGFGKSGRELVNTGDALVDMGVELLSKIKKADLNLPIYLYGRSLGSGIASGVAKINNVEGVVLETPYTSMQALAADLMPYVPSQILKIKLSNESLSNSNQENILLIHGTKDSVIDYSHSVKLFDLIKNKSKFVTIKDGSHNNLSDHPSYWVEIKKFFL